MNNFFSLTRFSRLLIKHSAEHYRTYLMSVSVLAGVMIVGGAFIVYTMQEPMDARIQTSLFMLLMPVSGCIFTSTVFSDMGDKRKAIPALTLPASAFEKYLVSWVYSYAVFIVVYTVMFYLVLLALINIRRWPGFDMVIFNVFQEKFLVLFIIFSLLHAISLYGAIAFDKLHFIKTAFCFFISMLVLILCNTFLLGSLVKQQVFMAVPFGYLEFSEHGEYYSVSLSDVQFNWVMMVLCLIVVLIWTAAYCRLREKQV
ncbi:hypothetical protein F0L74_21900 [Chitinophaga agrisoli]|uniref:ABC-2 family transporter n=1 Tax=Chitinophaga agrisoli TaxID=2607653 RepID=A0A5B2VIH2_9BACT|nr:hypothetical protein [Chitinophaga agrisoli]KAA2238871.1 hypothetical protein F0L74_21900 [Chitinophaga agrisoli]